MPESRLEDEKDALIQVLTEVYSRGAMDMPAFERSVVKIGGCGDLVALEAEAKSLGLALPPVPARRADLAPSLADLPEAVQVECVSGTMRKVGDWVRARGYRFALRSSNLRLDLTEYEGATGFRLFVDIQATSSNVRIVVPAGFEIEDRIEGRRSSNVRNRPRGPAYGDNVVVLSGALQSSNVRIKYSR